jgi:RNA polymerase sigma-70 factor (ECF subfamily)
MNAMVMRVQRDQDSKAEGSPQASEPAADPRIASAAAGDRQAAQALLTELLPRVRNLVRYLVWGDADVDDYTQLTLVAVMKSFHTYRAEGSLSAWVDRITVRITLSGQERKRTEDKRRELHAPELHSVGGRGVQADEYTLRRQTVRMLDALPDDQRCVVVLHHVMGLSVPEVAAELGIPFETARSRLRLGFQKLREQARTGES